MDKFYSKIELLVSDNHSSIKKLEFLNSYFTINSGFLIIDQLDDKKNLTGVIFNLKDVKSYKCYNEEK